MEQPADHAIPPAEPPSCATETPPVELTATTHDFLRALASPTRQQIMLLFARGAELTVGEVADRIGISQSTASEQLALLRRGRILTASRAGKTVLYRPDRDGAIQALDNLRDYLDGCC